MCGFAASVLFAAIVLGVNGCAMAEPCDIVVKIKHATRTISIKWSQGTFEALSPEGTNGWPGGKYCKADGHDCISIQASDGDTSTVLVKIACGATAGFDVCLENLGTVEEIEVEKGGRMAKLDGWAQTEDKLSLHIPAGKEPAEYRLTVRY
jgi:hypothetical protein